RWRRERGLNAKLSSPAKADDPVIKKRLVRTKLDAPLSRGMTAIFIRRSAVARRRLRAPAATGPAGLAAGCNRDAGRDGGGGDAGCSPGGPGCTGRCRSGRYSAARLAAAAARR